MGSSLMKQKVTDEQVREDHLKLSIEHHKLQRILRVVEAKKDFLLTRCYSWKDGKCGALTNEPACKMQCFERNADIHDPKTEDEWITFKDDEDDR
jgi:hypothetical protein